MQRVVCPSRLREASGFTLVELLITVAVLGVATVMVIPSMTQTNGLRVQAAVRLIVSDIAFAQADAMAYQSRRAIVFGQVGRPGAGATYSYVSGNGYTLAEPTGNVLDLAANAMYDPAEATKPLFRDLDDPVYGGSSITAANFSGGNLLIFDELGGPVTTLTGSEPASGTIDVSAISDGFRITVAPYTGYVTVVRREPASEPESP